MSILQSNLFQRVAAAAVGGPIIIALALWDNQWGFRSLVILAAVLGMFEYAVMAFTKEDENERMFTVLSGSIFCAFLMALIQYGPLVYPWIVLLVLTTMVFLTRNMAKATEIMGKMFVGIFFIAQLFAFLGLIKTYPQGGKWIIFTLTLVWFGDTAAYFVGRAIGKHKLCLSISPGKTWEGAIGGAVASMIAGYLGTLYISDLHIAVAIPLALFAGIMGQIGDLAESLLKRSYGVKDSGNIIPGHGGILDRFDALLFAAPIIWGYLVMLQLR
jgi:phosphatidate cytidylyltransferase